LVETKASLMVAKLALQTAFASVVQSVVSEAHSSAGAKVQRLAEKKVLQLVVSLELPMVGKLGCWLENSTAALTADERVHWMGARTAAMMDNREVQQRVESLGWE
jgi:hypothetical protein